MKTCKYPDCNRPLLAKGYCSTHYKHFVAGRTLIPIRDSATISERLWSRIDKTGDCWIWTGAKNNRGYGVIGTENQKLAYVHRLVWIETNGAIPENMEVCHSCDNPACARPDHLFIGTHKENMIDMAQKFRTNKAKLTPDTVLAIVRMHTDGIPRKEIVEITNVNVNTIKCILNGRNWSHLTGLNKQ